MVATAGHEEVDCEHFNGFSEYEDQAFVVCDKFGEIPKETCDNCPENGEKTDNDRPDYIL